MGFLDKVGGLFQAGWDVAGDLASATLDVATAGLDQDDLGQSYRTMLGRTRDQNAFDKFASGLIAPIAAPFVTASNRRIGPGGVRDLAPETQFTDPNDAEMSDFGRYQRESLGEVDRFIKNVVEFGMDRPLSFVPNIINMQTGAGQTGLDAWLPNSVNDLRGAYMQDKGAGAERSAGQAFAMLNYHGDTGRFANVIMGAWLNPAMLADLINAEFGGEDDNRGLTPEGRESIRITGGKMNTFDLASGSADFSANLMLDPFNLAGGGLSKAMKLKKGLITARNMPRVLKEIETGTGGAGEAMQQQVAINEALRQAALDAKSLELTKAHLEQVAKFDEQTIKSGETAVARVARDRARRGVKNPRITDEQILANVRERRVKASQVKGFDPLVSDIKATPEDLTVPDMKPWVIKQIQPDMSADMANLTASAMKIADPKTRVTAYRHITRLGIGDTSAARELQEMRSALAEVGDTAGNIGLKEIQHIIEKRPIEQGELQNLAFASDKPELLTALNKYNESWVSALQPNGNLDDTVAFIDKALEQTHSYRSFTTGGLQRAARHVAGTQHDLPITKAARQTKDNAWDIVSGKYALDQIERGQEVLLGGNASMSTLKVIANPIDTANEIYRALKTHAPNRIIPVGLLDRGINGLVDYMDKARVDPAVRNEILSQFASVTDDVARGGVAIKAEKAAIASLARHYGIDENTTKEIVARVGNSAKKAGRSERFAVNEYEDLEGNRRLADSWADADGTTVKPVLQSQHMEAVPLLDIAKFDKQMNRAHKRINAVGEWANHPSWVGENAAKLYDLGIAGVDALDSGLTYAGNLWKFFAVFHGGYTFRNVLDGDLSVAAHLGGSVSMKIIGTRILKFGLTKNLTAKRALTNDMTKLHELQMIGDDSAETLAEIARLEAKTSNPNNYRKMVGVEKGVRIGENQVVGMFEGLEGAQAWNLSKGDIGAAFTTDLGRKGLEKMRSASWVKIKNDEVGHLENWAHVVNRQFLQDKAAFQVIKNDLDEAGLVKWLATTEGRAYRKKLGEVGFDADDWAARAVSMVNHYLPPEVADELRRTGQEITPERLKQLVPDMDMRPDVHGQELASHFGKPSVGRFINRSTNFLMHMIGDLPDNHLTRHPTAAALYQMRAKELLTAHKGEILSPDELAQIASASRKFALNEIKKVLYDIDHHSNAATKMRFISPFFNAWQEGVKRYGIAVKDNPHQLYNAYRMWNAPNRNGFVIDEHGDPVTGPDLLNDEHRLAIPIWNAKAGQDWKTQGPRAISKSALNIALQGDPFWSPGAGTIVTVPMAKFIAQVNNENLEAWWTEYVDPYGTANTQGGAAGVAKAFMPAWMKRAQALNEGPGAKEMHAAYTQILQDEMVKWEQGGRVGPPPWKDEDRIMKMASHFQFMRFLYNMTLPFVPRNAGEFSFLRDKWRQLQDEGNANHPNEQGWAQTQFLETYGSDFFYLTMSGSKGKAGIAPTVGAEASYRENYGVIGDLDNPLIAGAITSPESGGEFSRMVYNAQFGEKVNDAREGPENMVRSRKDLPTIAHDAEVSRGWSEYRSLLHDLNAEAMDRGGESYQDFDDLNEFRKNAIKYLSYDEDGNATPWGEEFGQMRSPLAYDSYVDDFRKVIADPKLAKREDVKILAEYVAMRDDVRQELLQRESQNITNNDNEDLRILYARAVNHMAQANTVFDDVWYVRFISNDPYYDESIGTPEGTP